MRLLLDTHVLLWAAGQPEKLSRKARKLLDDPEIIPVFSAASLWEIAIKRGIGRDDFQVDPRLLRRGLLDNGYEELPVTGAPSRSTRCRRCLKTRSTACSSRRRWWKGSYL